MPATSEASWLIVTWTSGFEYRPSRTATTLVAWSDRAALAGGSGLGLTESNEFIARRYDRLVRGYRLVEVALGLPRSIRRRAVARLELRPGQRVGEVGCGSGRNLALLAAAVGPAGAVHGIDVSPGMLSRAARTIDRAGWGNVTVGRQDAAELNPAETPDAVLFSLSYSVIPGRRLALQRAWEALSEGGRIVIMDACLPEGRLGRLLRPAAMTVSKFSVLGDPDVRPWENWRNSTRIGTRSALRSAPTRSFPAVRGREVREPIRRHTRCRL